QLHSGSAPGAVASVVPAPVARAAPAAMIGEDEFEALLDQLHGAGIPGAAAVTAESMTVVPAAPASPPIASAAPVQPPVAAAVEPRAPAKAGEVEQTIRVDTRRLDAIVNLVGELVLARN